MSDQDTAPWAGQAAVPDWFAPAAPPPVVEAVARSRACVRRLQRFWAVAAQRDLPPPAATFSGEFSLVVESYLRTADGDVLEQLRWWWEAISPAVLSVVRAPDKPSALEIDVSGPLAGELDNPVPVRVVLFLAGAGHLATTAPRRTSWPELSGLLAGWQPPAPPHVPAAPPVSEQDPEDVEAADHGDGALR